MQNKLKQINNIKKKYYIIHLVKWFSQITESKMSKIQNKLHFDEWDDNFYDVN